MYRVGLTGGIASGKSTVAKFLLEMGIPVINLDQISREIVAKGTPGYREVLGAFGQSILNSETKEIDRKVLGQIVFSDATKRKCLEAITHPLIRVTMEEKIQNLESAGKKVVVVEVPLLIETQMMDQFDQVWLVFVDQDIQLDRLKFRDALDQEGAMARLNAQIPLKEKKKYADRIIHNTGKLEDLKKQLDELRRELKCLELL